MKIFYRISLVAFLAFAAVVPARATVFVVQALNFFYSPASLTVSAGDTVRFQWIAGTHPTSSTTGDWTSFVFFPLNSAEPSFDLVFPNPGTYNYQCDFHASLGMIGTVIVTGSPACSTALPPTGQTHTNLSNRVQLNWSPQSGAVACQVQGQRLPTGPSPSVNILSSPISTTNVPYAAAGAGTTWTWRVRCACSISPVLVSPYTSFGDTFSIPVAREGDLVELNARVFPNPAQDQLMLEYSSEQAGTAEIRIVDLFGRILEMRTIGTQAGINQTAISLSEYPNGVYFAQVGEAESVSFQVSR